MRQQRRGAAPSGRRTSTWCAAASLLTGWTRSAMTPPRWAGAGARAELLRCRGEAVRGGGERPDTASASWPSETHGWRVLRSDMATAGGAGASNNADVLIAGRRYPSCGTVSMDNITVDPAPTRARAARRRRRSRSGAQGSARIHRRGEWRSGCRRSTTRSRAHLRARFRRQYPPRRATRYERRTGGCPRGASAGWPPGCGVEAVPRPCLGRP